MNKKGQTTQITQVLSSDQINTDWKQLNTTDNLVYNLYNRYSIDIILLNINFFGQRTVLSDPSERKGPQLFFYNSDCITVNCAVLYNEGNKCNMYKVRTMLVILIALIPK